MSSCPPYLHKQQTLLEYRPEPEKDKPTDVVLLAIGPHENFYEMLKRSWEQKNLKLRK
ncbi:type II toxin-antitoxin system RelE/ParE family toxin [Rhodoferax fermentans]|uniref:type II toxin-antitoxin system RelE/ParE family toxin n=1 Tax=Rhodoferax fermentans TaxID=28066 RepID=UPI00117BB7BE|nr:type II toxin-antitoxin system RelE/ParE family toxin [Rhodoferax fermentans]